jgi:hypothetical protein
MVENRSVKKFRGQARAIHSLQSRIASKVLTPGGLATGEQLEMLEDPMSPLPDLHPLVRVGRYEPSEMHLRLMEQARQSSSMQKSDTTKRHQTVPEIR